jgi:hypothetical protein
LRETLVKRLLGCALTLVSLSSPVLALDEGSMFVDWAKSTRSVQARLTDNFVGKFITSGGYDDLLSEAKTARKRSNTDLSEFTVACMNKMNPNTGDDAGLTDIKIPVGDLLTACIETSLYN